MRWFPVDDVAQRVRPVGVETAEPEGGLRLLIVDDEESITDLLAMALRYEGFQVRVAATGRGALAAAASFRPHLIVLDVMLPDLDGLDVQQRLSADGLRVPILFLTARDSTEEKRGASA